MLLLGTGLVGDRERRDALRPVVALCSNETAQAFYKLKRKENASSSSHRGFLNRMEDFMDDQDEFRMTLVGSERLLERFGGRTLLPHKIVTYYDDFRGIGFANDNNEVQEGTGGYRPARGRRIEFVSSSSSSCSFVAKRKRSESDQERTIEPWEPVPTLSKRLNLEQPTHNEQQEKPRIMFRPKNKRNKKND